MRECDGCGRLKYPNDDSFTLKLCGGCRVTNYCCEECQLGHWQTGHKQECKQLKEWRLQNRLPPEFSEQASEAAAADAGGRSGSSSGEASTSGREQAQRAQRGRSLRCGLCGNRKGPFTTTDCCGRVVCDDNDNYVTFSYARNSCYRNHSRYTLCAHHYDERHKGTSWKDCKKCRADFDPYDYWVYGSNPASVASKSNFDDDVLDMERPPMPRCDYCGRDVDTAAEPYTSVPSGPDADMRLQCKDCSSDFEDDYADD